jgi:hypothetical protein
MSQRGKDIPLTSKNSTRNVAKHDSKKDSKTATPATGSNPFGRDSESDPPGNTASKVKAESKATTNPFGRDSESETSESSMRGVDTDSTKSSTTETKKSATTNPFGRDSESETLPPATLGKSKAPAEPHSPPAKIKMLSRTKSPIIREPSKRAMGGGADGSSKIFCGEDLDLGDDNNMKKPPSKRNMMLGSASAVT